MTIIRTRVGLKKTLSTNTGKAKLYLGLENVFRPAHVVQIWNLCRMEVWQREGKITFWAIMDVCLMGLVTNGTTNRIPEANANFGTILHFEYVFKYTVKKYSKRSDFLKVLVHWGSLGNE